MNRKHLSLESLEKTEILGKLLGEIAERGDILSLNGDLGAGKTTLTQAIAHGLGVADEYYVTSPSFNIFHEYPGRFPLYHMDFYRLNDGNDVLEMGLDEYFYKSGLVVIEWAEKAADILPDSCLFLSLVVKNQDCRELTIFYDDDYWYERVDIILSKLSEYK